MGLSHEVNLDGPYDELSDTKTIIEQIAARKHETVCKSHHRIYLAQSRSEMATNL